MSTNDWLPIVNSNTPALPVLSSEHGFYKYLQEVNNIPSLTPEEEFLLAKAYLEQNDISAAHKLVTSHLKLVVKMALKYRGYGLPVTELVSEGNLGLMQAVKKYNPELGYRLSTYAMWWIRAAIQEYVLRSWSLVKIGTTAAQKKLFFSLAKIKRRLSNLYARDIAEQDFSEIANALGLNRKDVAEMNMRLAHNDLSLNDSNNNDDEREMIDILEDQRVGQENLVITKEENDNKRKLLKQAMGLLNPRELNILAARKLKEIPETLDSLSQKYHISKERVRQIENKAFEKVQNFILTNADSSYIHH